MVRCVERQLCRMSTSTWSMGLPTCSGRLSLKGESSHCAEAGGISFAEASVHVPKGCKRAVLALVGGERGSDSTMGLRAISSSRKATFLSLSFEKERSILNTAMRQ